MSLVWRDDIPSSEWDTEIARLGGHPLQTALWGDARRRVDGINDHRWAVFSGSAAILMARIEERPIGPWGRVAWLPRGPVVNASQNGQDQFPSLLERLKAAGYLLCIDDQYSTDTTPPSGTALLPKPRTVWVDLAVGRDAVLAAMDSKARYSARAAARQGVEIEESRRTEDADAFFALCNRISEKKGFDLPGSAELLRSLLDAGGSPDAEARLFVARYHGHLAGGAAVLRCGRSLHYFWGGVDRAFSKQRTGEAVQVAILNWAIDQGVERYDLEGIDAVGNPGTYHFKMKMGGREVDLRGRRAHPLGVLGHVALEIGRRLGRI